MKENVKVVTEPPSTGYKEHLKKELREIKAYLEELQK